MSLFPPQELPIKPKNGRVERFLRAFSLVSVSIVSVFDFRLSNGGGDARMAQANPG
jgi:hypothetical protein